MTKRKDVPSIPKRVALVGFCNDSRERVPYEDATLEIWGLNRGYIFMQRADRWFDLHGPHIHACTDRRPGKHLDWLKQFKGPVYMHRADSAIPNSVTYPLEDVAKTIGSDLWRAHGDRPLEGMAGSPYLSSSIAMEIALAIHEGYQEIQLWGIDLNTESEYAWQKPGVEHLIGIALGRGIKVVLPDNCPLCQGNIYGRGYLSPTGERMSLEQLQTRAKALEVQDTETSRQVMEITGAKRELQFLMEQMIPGLDHERLDERRKSMQQAIANLQEKLIQLRGARNETAFWISQTPDGQNPKEAIEQLAGSNGHSDADGPLTFLHVMQSPAYETAEPVFSGA